jgi:DNA-binding MarR family transcriptional regulator
LSGNVREVRQLLVSAEEVERRPSEERISLAFDSFLMRTRMESYLSEALREVGMVAGDYALVSLLATEGQLTPALMARLVGVAPSTLGPRLNGLTRRGWVERRANPANSRSWLLQLTPAGWAAYHAAVPCAKDAFNRLDDALRDSRVDLVTLRQQIQILSTTLRSLLPDP